MQKKLWGTFSDEELLRASRAGDTEHFAELWERHRGAGIVAARNIAPTFDPEDIVSDAYVKIFELVRDGRGPTEAFRPYLYQVIRTVSADRLRSPELNTSTLDVAALEEVPGLDETSPWHDAPFDLNAVTRAFGTLTPRWQAVLWYTEVEGLPPREAAPLLGLSANSTSALAVRAREALQSAWVEAHAGDSTYDEECDFTRKNLQKYQRGKLRSRASREVEVHLEQCNDCPEVVAEFTLLNKQLGLVLGIIMLGGAGAAALLGKLSLAGASGGALVGAGATGAAGAAGASASHIGNVGGVGGIGAPAAIASGVAVGVLAIVGSVALAVSLLSPPVEPSGGGATDATASSEPSANDEDSNEISHDDKPLDDEADPTAEEDAGSEVIQVMQHKLVPPPNPTPPTTSPTPPVGPGNPGGGTGNPGGGTGGGSGNPGGGSGNPGGGSGIDPGGPGNPPGSGHFRPTYDIGFDCYLPGSGMIGTANRYGVMRLRVTAPGGTPIELFNPQYDPAFIGQPGHPFETGIFHDLAGNTFDFGFFTGTDNTPALDWFAEDPEQFPAWSTHFPGLTPADVLLEIQLVAPNHNYSSWNAIDASVTC